MNLGVAVSAGAVKDKPLGRSEGTGEMAGLNVALLAEPGHSDLQEISMDRAVGVMAAQAVLPHRWVLPEKRTALLCVAFVAVFVDGVLGQQSRGSRAMRVVTVGAGHLPLPQGHMRGAQKLGPPLEVALEADL